jgi:hypothetical protein
MDRITQVAPTELKQFQINLCYKQIAPMEQEKFIIHSYRIMPHRGKLFIEKI